MSDRRALALRLGLLAILLGGLGVVGLRSAREVQLQQDIEAVCQLARDGDHAGAVTAAEPLLDRVRGATEVDLIGCRCPALSALGRGSECLPALARVVDEPDLPASTALLGLQLSLEAGDEPASRAWFARAHALPPEQTLTLRLRYADRIARAGQVDEALAALEPSPAAGPDAELWFLIRNRMLADHQRLPELVQSYQRWQREGGIPARLALQYAWILETRGLDDGQDPARRYEDAIAGADPSRDQDLLGQAYRRLAVLYTVGGQPERAADTLARAQALGLSVSLSADELARLGGGTQGGSGLIRFDLPGFLPGDLLLVSPADTAPADAPYERVVLQGPREALERDAGDTPVRWVWTDAEGRPLASGAVWPSPAAPVDAGAPGDRPVPTAPPSPWSFAPRPADGQPRVYVLILDCGDWRLIRYLQARGELPALSALEAAGRAGVLTSVPAMTGTAMEKLTRPRVAGTMTLLSYAHHLGAELGGLSSVGKNPLEALSWVLPDNPYILDLVGQTERVGANMLFSHGAKVEAGRNAELIGPRGQRRELTGLTWRRALRPDERALFPGVDPIPSTVEDIAAEMDALTELITRREIDLLLLRVEPLDLLTHANYAETARAGRDDARPLLYPVYRYLDLRLREAAGAVDADDTLILMSDHGIQASMLHDPEAMLIAVGPGLSPGRLDGQPELAGIPRALLDRLGLPVPEGWPDTGLSAALAPPAD